MLYLLVFCIVVGFLMLILGFFSYRNAVLTNHTRGFIVIIMGISIVLITFGLLKLPHQIQIEHENTMALTNKQREQASSDIRPKNADILTGKDKKQRIAHQKLEESKMKSQLNQGYKTMGPITFHHSSRTYTLTIANDDYNKAMKYLASNPDLAKQIGWQKSVKSFRLTSTTIRKALGKEYKFKVVAKIPKEKTIFIGKNGHTIYNFVK